ncbi:hypothetical protein R0137_06890 [Congregibacter brevis]|uniref:Uncharacterized protein n=1 Tax=Congregibacter brevis TaxID=3081201 RepID=A0ABZ0IFH0_9GAMM|nr:hypothetical protein R0137_06890 [Congregibacter sp. IMCC45268]
MELAHDLLLRRFGQYRMRRIRQLLPYPKIWALAFGKSIPSSSYVSRDASLRRPETICLSSKGDKVVVSNTGSSGIAVLGITNSLFGIHKITAQEVFIDKELYRYAHGASFGANDSAVIAVGEYADTMSAFSLKEPPGENSSRILWVVRDPAHGLDHPADVAIHPGGQWLAVANRMAAGLTFFRIEDPNLQEAPNHSSQIDTPSLNLLGLGAPHGVAFSQCGTVMYVTHKPYFNNPSDTGQSAVSVFSCNSAPPDSSPWDPLAIYDCGCAELHHVAAHPSEWLLCVTNSQGNAEILEWCPDNAAIKQRGFIDVHRIGEGAKGVAFTNSGEHIMVTTELNEILFFKLSRYFRRHK